MALIKCPECGKEISDKSKQCIHCGCPIKQPNLCIINGVEHDLSFLIDGSCDIGQAIAKMNAITGGCFATTGKIVSEIRREGVIPPTLKIKTERQYLYEESLPKCPKCGSTAITTGQRGYSILTGFLGSNKTVNRCASCGYSWKPGR